MALADDLIDDVAAVLDDEDFGRDITIRRYTPGAYNESTATTAAGTQTNTQTRGIILGYKDFTIYASGGAIMHGDRRCIVKVKDLDMEPDVGDQVIAGDDIYTVESRKRVELGGTTIVFILQMRGLSR